MRANVSPLYAILYFCSACAVHTARPARRAWQHASLLMHKKIPMTTEISRHLPRALETHSHASYASQPKVPYSPPTTPGLPPSTMNPLDTKHTGTDILSSSEGDSGFLQPCTSAITIHHPPTPPSLSTNTDAEDVPSHSSPCSSVLSEFPGCYRSYSLRQQQEVPESSLLTDSPRGHKLQRQNSVTAEGQFFPYESTQYNDEDLRHAGQLQHVVDETASAVLQEGDEQGDVFMESRPSVVIPIRSSSLPIMHKLKPVPYRHGRSSPFPASGDHCFHYSSVFNSSTSPQAARSNLRRLRRRSLQRINSVASNIPGALNTNPAIPSMSTSLSPSNEQQSPQLPPSMQPLYHSATYLRGRRRLTIDKCMRARQQQYGEERNSIGNRVDYDDEHGDTSNGYNNSADNGGIARSPFMNRSSWNVASSYQSLRPPLHLSPNIQLGEMEETTELDEEEEVWGSPDLVAAMRPLSSAACSWSNVAMVDSLAEGGLHLGPWASTA